MMNNELFEEKSMDYHPDATRSPDSRPCLDDLIVKSGL
ncbi:hypothetical protein ASZ90_010057 [hydrocarbon metagenome]|uniref:Uncharacterized protein n=1 Tax=hydrocarbon metagenome TaxID=938273 RepID=A0A0W8FIS0_9ZZZZ